MKLFVVRVFCVLAHTMKADNKKAVIKVLILKNIKPSLAIKMMTSKTGR